jgi:rhodanese-related sulfurtransferase
MNWRRFFLEAATLIAAAVVCAFVANAFASRERKVTVVSATATAAPPAVQPKTVAPPPVVPAPSPQPTTTTVAPVTTATTTTPHPAPRATLSPPAGRGQGEGRAFNPHPDKPYIELHGDDVEALHKQGVLFLDARRTSVYEQGHIPGARPYSVWEADIDEKVNKLFAERSDPKDQNLPIVVYCSGGDCEDSHMLAQKLWGIQFNNVYVYKDGFPDWQKRGLPVHTGSNP